MTKEQEEAIDRLRKITNRQILYGNKYGIVIEEFKKLQEDIETVLNMLKEKEAEIAEYKNIIEAGIINAAKDELVEEKNKEIEKKDKMIDLMAVEIGDISNNSYCNSTKECNDEACKNCIKEYFERKVEDECKR